MSGSTVEDLAFRHVGVEETFERRLGDLERGSRPALTTMASNPSPAAGAELDAGEAAVHPCPSCGEMSQPSGAAVHPWTWAPTLLTLAGQAAPLNSYS